MCDMDQHLLMTSLTIISFLILSSSKLFETVLAQETYDVRLVGGSNTDEGRVEIFYSSEWGTICDDSWGAEESMVVCRQLGYGGISETVGQGEFPQGTGMIWLDDVSCQGSEALIASCSHRSWGSNDCSHAEDVGVRCYTGTDIEGLLQLSGGGTADEGRVEIYHSGEWGTVCDDDWDLYDGTVACRQLGYPGADQVYGEATFGQGYGRIWLDDVQCNGMEQTLAACPSNDWGTHNCDHYEDAGVRCSPRAVEGMVRLVNGPRASEGRLEIYHNDQWGTVCDDNWDNLDSQVVCKQLGQVGDGYFTTASRGYEKAIGPIWLDNVACAGNEERLEYCTHSGFGINDCQHSEDVGVQCSKDDGLSDWEIAGIVVGCLVGVFFFYHCFLKGNKAKNSSEEPTPDTEGPVGDALREGTQDFGDVSREGTTDHTHSGDADSSIPDLPPPSYDDIGKYTSFSVPGSEPGVYPPPASYLPPTAPYSPSTAPYPPAPPVTYPLPPFSDASVTYHTPSDGHSGVVPNAPPAFPPSS